MSPHDFRRLALALDLLAQSPAPAPEREADTQEASDMPEDRTPVMGSAQAPAG